MNCPCLACGVAVEDVGLCRQCWDAGCANATGVTMHWWARTPRIHALWQKGHTGQQIADLLGVSRRTVSRYLSTAKSEQAEKGGKVQDEERSRTKGRSSNPDGFDLLCCAVDHE